MKFVHHIMTFSHHMMTFVHHIMTCVHHIMTFMDHETALAFHSALSKVYYRLILKAFIGSYNVICHARHRQSLPKTELNDTTGSSGLKSSHTLAYNPNVRRVYEKKTLKILDVLKLICFLNSF